MLAGIEARSGWLTLFFVTYTVLMTLLFTNLVIGIFVNANEKVRDAHKK